MKVVFVGALLVQFLCFVYVFVNSEPEFVTDSKVVDCNSESFVRRLLEPRGSLLVLFELLEKQTAEGIHTFDVTVSGSGFVVSYSYLQVLVDNSEPMLIVRPDLKVCFFEGILTLKITLALSFSEVLEGKLPVGFSVGALRVDSLLEEHTYFVKSIRLLILSCVVEVSKSFVQVFFDTNTLLVESSQHKHGLRVV